MSIPEWPTRPSAKAAARNGEVAEGSNQSKSSVTTAREENIGASIRENQKRDSHTGSAKGSSIVSSSRKTSVLETKRWQEWRQAAVEEAAEEDVYRVDSSHEAAGTSANLSSDSSGLARESIDTMVRKSIESGKRIMEQISELKIGSEGEAKSILNPSPSPSESSLSRNFLKSASQMSGMASLKLATHDTEIITSGDVHHEGEQLHARDALTIKSPDAEGKHEEKVLEIKVSDVHTPNRSVPSTSVAAQSTNNTLVREAREPGDRRAKGDFNEAPKMCEVSDLRKQLYIGFSKEKIVPYSAVREPGGLAYRGDRSGRFRPHEAPAKKLRSPLLSMASGPAPVHSARYTTSAEVLLDQVFPRGARELLAMLENPADLEGLVACMQNLERQERLLSALRLLEQQERTASPSQSHKQVVHAQAVQRRRHRLEQLWLQPSYRLPPSHPPDLSRAHRLLHRALELGLEGVAYSNTWAPDVCRVIAAFITQEIKALGLRRYKTSCLVRVIEKHHQRICTSMAVLWDPSTDSYCEAHHEKLTFYAQALLFIIHLD